MLAVRQGKRECTQTRPDRQARRLSFFRCAGSIFFMNSLCRLWTLFSRSPTYEEALTQFEIFPDQSSRPALLTVEIFAPRKHFWLRLRRPVSKASRR